MDEHALSFSSQTEESLQVVALSAAAGTGLATMPLWQDYYDAIKDATAHDAATLAHEFPEWRERSFAFHLHRVYAPLVSNYISCDTRDMTSLMLFARSCVILTANLGALRMS